MQNYTTAVGAETDRCKYHVTKMPARKGIQTEKDLVVAEKILPTSVVDYRPGDAASTVDIVPDIINSRVPRQDC